LGGGGRCISITFPGELGSLHADKFGCLEDCVSSASLTAVMADLCVLGDVVKIIIEGGFQGNA
jgi:hypothetical protein